MTFRGTIAYDPRKLSVWAHEQMVSYLDNLGTIVSDQTGQLIFEFSESGDLWDLRDQLDDIKDKLATRQIAWEYDRTGIVS